MLRFTYFLSLWKLHRNVHSSLDRLEKFIFTEWKFSALKTMDLQVSSSFTISNIFNKKKELFEVFLVLVFLDK